MGGTDLTSGQSKQGKEKLEGDSRWRTYKNKKKESWRRVVQGDLLKQGKEKLEGDSHWRNYKNKNKKSWGGLTLGDL